MPQQPRISRQEGILWAGYLAGLAGRITDRGSSVVTQNDADMLLAIAKGIIPEDMLNDLVRIIEERKDYP